VQGLLSTPRSSQKYIMLLQGGHVQSVSGARIQTHGRRAQLGGPLTHDQLRYIDAHFLSNLCPRYSPSLY